MTDGITAANGTYDLGFALFDAASGGNQIGSTVTRAAVNVTNGVFTVQLDFDATAFPGADRYLEVRVKKPTDANFTTLTPRQQVTSAPYAIRALNATSLGGTAASQYVQTNDARLSDMRSPTAGSDFYIQNTTTQQSGASFNISGGSTLGDALNINAPAAGKALNITKGRVILSYVTVTGGTTPANAGIIPGDVAVVEATDNATAGSAATVTLSASSENGTIIVVGTSDPDGAVVFGVSGSTSYAFNNNQSARFTRIAGTWKFLP